MVLSDAEIARLVRRGELGIDPFEPALLGPTSLDLRLASNFLLFRTAHRPYVDVRLPAEGLYEQVEAAPDEPFVLQPGAFALAATLERLSLPAHTMARVDGRSSLGRLGVLVHATAGLVDPGFEGRLTLELSNQAPLPAALYPGMRIAQLSFYRLSLPARRPYGERGGRSKYQGQDAPTPSLIYLDFA